MAAASRCNPRRARVRNFECGCRSLRTNSAPDSTLCGAAGCCRSGGFGCAARTFGVRRGRRESIREIVQEGLVARGMTVEGASSSEEALPHLAAHSYDFVLCDFNLPGLNGEEFFKRIQPRAGTAAPKFVFMSGALLDPATLGTFHGEGRFRPAETVSHRGAGITAERTFAAADLCNQVAAGSETLACFVISVCSLRLAARGRRSGIAVHAKIPEIETGCATLHYFRHGVFTGLERCSSVKRYTPCAISQR